MRSPVIEIVFSLTGLCVFSMFLYPTLANSQSYPQRVIFQSYDDDCGIAALQMLLMRHGHVISQKDLISKLDAEINVDALSAADLSTIVDDLDIGLNLDIGFMPIFAALDMAKEEPFLILISPRRSASDGIFKHFVVVEGVLDQNLILADPYLGSRTKLGADAIPNITHGRAVGDDFYMMVLRLSQNKRPARLGLPMEVPSRPISTVETAYNQPHLLPPRKTVVSTEISFQNSTARLEDGSVFNQKFRTHTLLLERGIKRNLQVSFSLSKSSGEGTIDDENYTTHLIYSAPAIATIAANYIPEMVLPSGLSILTSSQLTWQVGSKHVDSRIDFDVDYSLENTGIGLNYTIHDSTNNSDSLSPYAYVKFGFLNSKVADVNLSSQIKNNFDLSSYQIDLNLSTKVDKDLSLTGSFGFKKDLDVKENSFFLGLKITQGIPRRFRNSYW